ncbi:MAG TPA: DUF971 domain-containing protein [Polyangiaceae bacterium]|nr:DUF971 domain-containing protein [Polyangiaceae bacterium]
MSEDPRFTPLEFRAPHGGYEVEILWADGQVTHYENDVLRGFCPSALWQGHQGPLRYIPGGDSDLLDIEEVGNYGVKLTWPDNDTGIYTYRFLRELGELEGDPRRAQFGR